MTDGAMNIVEMIQGDEQDFRQKNSQKKFWLLDNAREELSHLLA
jgi:hypothetical protein